MKTTKTRIQKETLTQLLERVTEQNKHQEVDTGADMGVEVWWPFQTHRRRTGEHEAPSTDTERRAPSAKFICAVPPAVVDDAL